MFKIKSVRPFMGAKNYKISRQFYSEVGFEEVNLGPKMCLFKMENFGFYLQDYYAKDWIDNTMVFLEVEDLKMHLQHFKKLELDKKYEGVRLSEIQKNDWGNEFFLHDPSGILWHIGEFKK